jgi:hypothetical protein
MKVVSAAPLLPRSSFFNLNQQFVTFTDHVLDAGLAHRDALRKVLAGNFLERQEAVAVFAVVDEAGFQAGFPTRVTTAL